MAQTGDGISLVNGTVEMSTNFSTWTDISGFSNSLVPEGAERATGELATADGDTPVLTTGKLSALVRSLTVELAPQVRVNAVVPGPVLPPPGYTQEQRALGTKGTLLGRWGSPQDVADAILFLVRADYVTGEALFVDGGERWAHRLAEIRHE